MPILFFIFSALAIFIIRDDSVCNDAGEVAHQRDDIRILFAESFFPHVSLTEKLQAATAFPKRHVQWCRGTKTETTQFEANTFRPISCQAHSRRMQKDSKKGSTERPYLRMPWSQSATKLSQIILISTPSLPCWVNRCIVSKDPRGVFCIHRMIQRLSTGSIPYNEKSAKS